MYFYGFLNLNDKNINVNKFVIKKIINKNIKFT